MSVVVNYTSALQCVESLNQLGLITNFNHTELNTIFQNLGSSSTPPCSKVAVLFYRTSGNAGTLDLTNLAAEVGGYTQTVDASNGGGTSATDYAQFVKFIRPTSAQITARGGTPDSGGSITIKAGLSNSYNLLGASFLFTLQPGQEVMASLNSLAPIVTPTTKNIALTSVDAIDELWIMLIFGGP